MANLVIIRKKYNTDEALKNVVNYIVGEGRCNCYAGAQNLMLDDALLDIYVTQNFFYNADKNRFVHMVLTLDESDYIFIQDFFLEGYKICKLLPNHQIMFSVHNNTNNMHMHIGIIPVNLETGKRFVLDHSTLYSFLGGIRMILKKYDINVGLIWK